MRALVAIAIAGLVTVALTSANTTRAATDGKTTEASPSTTDEARQTVCDAFWERKGRREQLVHDTEPKDPAWAVAMEQKLSEYTARRFRTSQIVVTGIDCKTTFCTITAEGFVPEMNKEFDHAMAYLPELPWNDFGRVTLSRQEESDKMLYGAEVHRRQSPTKTREQLDEERTEAACGELMSRRSQRERAARDAQPRDVSWAGPTEQLLREYLASQLMKRPVDNLDVTCRTTFCLVKASGRTFESYSAFHKAVREVVAEPWSDLENAGGQGDAEGDIWNQEFTLDRRSAHP